MVTTNSNNSSSQDSTLSQNSLQPYSNFQADLSSQIETFDPNEKQLATETKSLEAASVNTEEASTQTQPEQKSAEQKSAEQKSVEIDVSLRPDIGGFRIRRIMRWVGYGLFLLYWVDVAYILYPPDFTNIVWEYQAMGDLVRLVPTLLLSLILIFYGETEDRRKIERPVLKILSWSILLIALFHLLMVPLTLVNASRISNQNNQEISTQVNQQKKQLEATRQQLEQASSEQLESLIPVPDERGALPNAPETPEEAKAQVITRLGEARRSAEDQAASARKNLKENLLKNTAKILLEAGIGAFVLTYIWALTKWARQLKSYGRNNQEIQAATDGKRRRKVKETGSQPLSKKIRKRRQA